MLTGREILQEVKLRADNRTHEVWLRILEIRKKEVNKVNPCYNLTRYTELKKLLHRVKKYHYNYVSYQDFNKSNEHIRDIKKKIDEIKFERSLQESSWERYFM